MFLIKSIVRLNDMIDDKTIEFNLLCSSLVFKLLKLRSKYKFGQKNEIRESKIVKIALFYFF